MILIVEDETDVREELVEMLELRGFVVRGAPGVPSAMEFLRSHTGPLALLTDLRLRDGSGLDLVREIGADPDLGEKVQRIILMTGHIDITEQVERDIERRDLDILFKPVDLGKLVGLLSEDALP